MKKLLLSLFALASVQVASAQNFYYPTGNSLDEYTLQSGGFTTTLKLAKNQNGDPITFVWETLSVDTVLQGSAPSIAFGICDNVSCYPNFVGQQYTMNAIGGAGSYGSFKLQCFSVMEDVKICAKILVWDINSPSVKDTVEMCWGTKNMTLTDLVENTSLNLFPNPATSQTTVQYNLGSKLDAKFEILNLVGTTVYSKELSEVEAKFDLNLEKLPKGVYLYILKVNNNAILSRRLIVE